MATAKEETKKLNAYKVELVTDKKKIKTYSKDPYFKKKNKEASDFLQKAGLPENFKEKPF